MKIKSLGNSSAQIVDVRKPAFRLVERLLDSTPLQVKHAQFVAHFASQAPFRAQFIIPNRAAGYEWEADHLTGRDGNLTDLMGAGSIVSTITDMVKWDAALSGNTFLKPESKRAIWTQFTFNEGKPSPYGFGWRISDVRGHKLIGHTGQTAGFGSANFRYVDDNVIVMGVHINSDFAAQIRNR